MIAAQPAAAPSAAGDTLSIEQWLEDRPISGLQWLVLFATSAIMLVDGFDLQALALAVPAMSREWNVGPEAMSLAFSVSLLGIGAGALIFGMLGDKFGRRHLLWIALLIVAISSGATALATNPYEVAVLRFLTGLGIGAANMNSTALITDYAPPRRRFLMVMIVGCNVGLGASLAGALAPEIIAAYGWRGVFALGGLLPLALAVLVFFALPESLSYSAVSRREVFTRLARRIDPRGDPARIVVAQRPATAKVPIVDLFTRGLWVRTVVLWLLYTIGSSILYLLVSWLPTLLIEAGWQDDIAIRSAITLQMGGIVGSIIASLFIDRGHLVRATIAGYAIAATGLLALPFVPPTVLLWSIIIFGVGIGVMGNQLILIAAAAALYPEHLRATSAGGATAVARIGAVMAPVIGGMAIAAKVAPVLIMAWLAAPIILQIVLLAAARRHFVSPARKHGNA